MFKTLHSSGKAIQGHVLLGVGFSLVLVAGPERGRLSSAVPAPQLGPSESGDPRERG